LTQVNPGSSSHELFVSCRVRSSCDPACCSQTTSTSLGVWLSFAASNQEIHLPTAFPPQLTVRPQRFSRSRRLTPSWLLEAYFILQPRPRFTLQGLSPHTSRRCSSHRRALLPFTPNSCGLPLLIAQKLPSVPALGARLQGFAPTYGPLPPTDILRLPVPDPLLSFHTCGLYPNTLEAPSRPLHL
jgi:hypothetical protein